MYLTEEEIAIYEQEVLLKEDKDILMEMSNLRKSDTGLDENIWLYDDGCYRNVKHNVPRIKFQNDNSDRINKSNLIPISISDTPQILKKNVSLNIDSKELNRLKEFIILNKEALLKHWNNEISFLQFGQLMKRVDNKKSS